MNFFQIQDIFFFDTSTTLLEVCILMEENNIKGKVEEWFIPDKRFKISFDSDQDKMLFKLKFA